MSCDEVRTLLGGHVLGALEPEEEAAVVRHLQTCPDCSREREELAGVPRVLNVLDSPEEPEEPPATLEEALLDRFARERRGLAHPAPPRAPRRARWRPRALALTGAAVAVAVAGVVAAIALTGGGDGSDSSRRASAPPPAAKEAAFGHVKLYGSGGYRAGGAGGAAELRAIPAGTRVSMSVRGLPARPSPLYEVWCIRDDGRWISGGTFRVNREGGAKVDLTTAARAGEYEDVRITKRSTGKGYGPSVLRGRVYY